MKRIMAVLGTLTLTVLAATPAVAAEPAEPELFAPDTNCTGSIGATTIPGKLVVPDGATCTLTGTHILGSLEVKINSTLRATRIRVEGDALATQARLASITSGSYVVGHVQFSKGITATFTGSTPFGGVELVENSGRATLTGSTFTESPGFVAKNRGGAVVDNNRAGDALLVQENSNGTWVRGNTIVDNLNVSKNLGGTVISNNRAGDNIDCTDNSPAPTGSGNVAGTDGGGSKTGQCAGL
ncbi:hypothetical protein EV643_109127 [Kribbella sp. VKM Ac-2527]|uniref:Parallel beta helix pectate lyase-like protein n=1 Tax=Kribbella caucasensis TaxID=2512215 RepID=A0A4R6KCU4_9ACTN|nr:hypothetical protein [Kribbella sp. VKM Ac-2527]TDO47234.1 hypothetical protein EV643_109127 [Kribbella sp. VKM Ac-2527]